MIDIVDLANNYQENKKKQEDQELIMEAIKEIKILHYVIIIILGLQLSFTFKKLNQIQDEVVRVDNNVKIVMCNVDLLINVSVITNLSVVCPDNLFPR